MGESGDDDGTLQAHFAASGRRTDELEGHRPRRGAADFSGVRTGVPHSTTEGAQVEPAIGGLLVELEGQPGRRPGQ